MRSRCHHHCLSTCSKPVSVGCIGCRGCTVRIREQWNEVQEWSRAGVENVVPRRAVEQQSTQSQRSRCRCLQICLKPVDCILCRGSNSRPGNLLPKLSLPDHFVWSDQRAEHDTRRGPDHITTYHGSHGLHEKTSYCEDPAHTYPHILNNTSL